MSPGRIRQVRPADVSQEHKKHRSRHPHVLKGPVYCAVCQRRMQGQRSNGCPLSPIESSVRMNIDIRRA
jgi:hypothetical protein